MVDGGDLFGPRNQNDREQARFLSEMVGTLGMDAIGLGEADLNYGLDVLREMMEAHGLPFINANVRDKDGQLILPPYRVVERNGVKYGVVSVLDPQQRIITMSNEDDQFTVDDPVTVLRELLPKMREEAESIVLLAHVGDVGVENLLNEVRGVDICVIGHTFRNTTTERVIHDTAVFSSAYEGRYMGRADLFVEEGTGRVMAIDVDITSLDDAVADDAEMKARVEQFKEDLIAFKTAKREAYPRVYGSKDEKFLGERDCMKCHEDAWRAYAESGHRRAYNTLRAKGQSDAPECLVCHTTGYQHHNGYSDEPPFNRLSNVQCEACHGYGTEHARDGKWRAQAKDSCVTCHDKENSPEFDYATYWEKIKH